MVWDDVRVVVLVVAVAVAAVEVQSPYPAEEASHSKPHSELRPLVAAAAATGRLQILLVVM